jgi:NAD dependent epimerase/dehydratase family enzyme
LVLKYDGSVDTNDGLDRATLLINTVVQGSKTLEAAAGSLSSSLMNSTAQLAFGVAVNSAGTPIESVYFTGEAKDLIIRSASGATVEINLPVVRDGQDTSGNNRDGTWV